MTPEERNQSPSQPPDQPAFDKIQTDHPALSWLGCWIEWEGMPRAELITILSQEIVDPRGSDLWRTRCTASLGILLGRTPRQPAMPPPEPVPQECYLMHGMMDSAANGVRGLSTTRPLQEIGPGPTVPADAIATMFERLARLNDGR